MLSNQPYDLEVVPSTAVGPFRLGDSLWRVIELLRSARDRYQAIDVSWDHENPIRMAVILTIASHIHLIFPITTQPHEQILQRIDIDLNPQASSNKPEFTFSYKSQPLHSSSSPLKKGSIAKIFGPTFDNASPSTLCYPGLGFTLSAAKSNGHEKSNGTGLVKLQIFQNQMNDHVADSKMMERDLKGEWQFLPNRAMLGTVSKCEVEPGKSVTIHFHSSEPSPPYIVTLNTTSSQDLLLELGSPLRKYNKEDHRFDDLWNGETRGQAVGENEPRGKKGCWWNYFQLGLDFLIDEASGKATKILIHSNIPGTALFQRHARCPWVIAAPSGPVLTFTDSLNTISAAFSEISEEPTPPSSVESSDASRSSRSSGAKKKTKHTQVLSKADGQDRVGLATMSLERAGDTGLEDVINIGPSRILALPGMILEEAERGGITEVLLYA